MTGGPAAQAKEDLVYTILAMDSYNCGYRSGIANLFDKLNAEIGSFRLIDHSNDAVGSQAFEAGFCGIAYKDDATGQTVIAYRGAGNNADLNSNRDGSDLVHGSGNDNSRAAFFLRGRRRLAA